MSNIHCSKTEEYTLGGKSSMKQTLSGLLFVGGMIAGTLCNMTSGCVYGVLGFGIAGLVGLVLFLGFLSSD